jgi:hypothetical protein
LSLFQGSCSIIRLLHVFARNEREVEMGNGLSAEILAGLGEEGVSAAVTAEAPETVAVPAGRAIKNSVY